MSTSTDSTDKKSRLLDLPPELRLIIYDFYFSAYTFDFTKAHDEPSSLNPPLLNTCQLMREEALDVYESHVHTYRKLAEERHYDREAQRELEFEQANFGGPSSLKWIALNDRFHTEAREALTATLLMWDAYEEELRKVNEAMEK